MLKARLSSFGGRGSRKSCHSEFAYLAKVKVAVFFAWVNCCLLELSETLKFEVEFELKLSRNER